METKTLNREWVKNAAIIFLAVLLVLTFFSNTILNRSLPEAATKPVTNGTIEAKVRGSGTVEANGAHEVKMKQTKEIRSVMVKVGDQVNAGDVLFVLGAGDSKELETAKETLRELQYSYQRAAVGMPNFDYTAQNRAVEKAELNLYDAEDAYDEAKKLFDNMKARLDGDPETDDSAAELAKAAGEMEAAYAKLQEVQQSYDAKYTELADIVAAWQNRVNELMYVPEPEPEDEPEPVDPAQPTVPEQPSVPAGTDPVQDGEGEGEGEGETGGEAENLQPTALSARAMSRSRVKLSDADIVSYSDTTPKPSTVNDLATAEGWLRSAQDTLTAFINSNEQTLKNAQAVYDSALNKYEVLLKYDNEIWSELAPYKEALEKAERELVTAEAAYNDAWSSLYYSQTSNEKTLALSSIELQQINEKIQLQQEKIKLLSGETEDQILANVSGIVQSVSATAGNTVTADTVLCTIEVPDMGHTLSFSVTNEQARRLRVGDVATVSNFYWGNEIVATLTNIRTDPKNPQSNKVLSFQLEGDVQSGSELTLSVGSKSANYDLIVPNSAIKSDSNGSFVLAIEAKNSPLGSRYIAKRVSVEVLAADDNNSAVLAELTNGDFVITTSSAPVKSGDQVRLADS